MSTPNSGTQTPSLINNLGDTGKLNFLNDIPMDDSPAAGATVESNGNSNEHSNTEGSNEAANNNGKVAADEFEAPPLDVTADETETEVEEASTAKPARTAEGAVSAAEGVRDYSDIEPADVPHFKQMSDKAYQVAKDWYKSHRSSVDIESKYTKELTELRDYKFYQHPEAYKLSPDYSKAAQEFRAQSAIINHYTRALEQLEAGEPIQDIGIDDKGNPVVIPGEIPATPALKAQVSVALQRAMSAQNAVQGKLESLSTTYQNKSKEFDEFLGKATDALVSPALLQDKTFKSAHDKYLTKVIPPHLQNVPVYKQMAKMAAFIQVASSTIATLQKKGQTASVKQAAARQQGPGDGMPASGAANIDDMPVADVLKEFEMARRR